MPPWFACPLARVLAILALADRVKRVREGVCTASREDVGKDEETARLGGMTGAMSSRIRY